MYEVLIGACKINLNLNVGPLIDCRIHSFETEEEADAMIASQQRAFASLEQECNRRPDKFFPDCGKFLLVKRLY